MISTTLAGRYHILKVIGTGGFGKTYLATDQARGDRPCVVKHLTPASDDPQFLDTARRLFRNEARALERLGQHDRIPQLIDAFEEDNEFYLVQAYVEGHALSEEWAQGRLLTADQTVELLQDVLNTLAFIHGQQVIHRDIKPSNLMRRRDGKIALIDFGAVKEITTHLQTSSLDQFTVSIGTQGYASAEQLAGRPRYSSDLYALGMTAIHALTGKSPNALPEDPETGALQWEDALPDIPAGLRIVLQRLTQSSVHRRYSTAQEALADLAALDTLAESQVFQMPDTTLMGTAPSLPRQRRWGWSLVPLAMAALVLAVRQVGGWVPLELMIYDRLQQAQPQIAPDPRLLLVEITETDLQTLQRPTPEDATLATAIATLQAHGPRVVGLDMYRNLPEGTGHAELMAALEAPNVVVIEKLGDRPSETISAPASVPPERVGFNDMIVDADGVIRRNLLMATAGNAADSPVVYSFGLRLALQYLAEENMGLEGSAANPTYFALGGTTFFPLNRTFGAYRTVDDAGYQVPLRYASGPNVTRRLSLGELLAGEFDPDWIRDRIVLIGTTAASAKDLFYTPYSRGATADHQMAGVTLHAQTTSQLLRVALDGDRLPWAWPEAVEIGWVIVLAGAGGAVGMYGDRRHWLSLGGGVLLAIAVGIPLFLFSQGGWIPLFPGAIALGGSLVGTVIYRSYQQRQPLPPPTTEMMSQVMGKP
jgi:CHASE2 domain-containing sensor protein/tRNA A-37 threonylcarbamoyl transferase component Bud32